MALNIKAFYVDAREAIKQNINVDMFAMQESKYYARQKEIAVQTTLSI